MKYFYVVIVLLTTMTRLTAQENICGFSEEQALAQPDGLPLWGDPRLLPDYPDTKYVRIAIYDVKGGPMPGVSETDATQVLRKLNQLYQDHKIQFHLIEYDTIDCSDCDSGIDDQVFTHKRNNCAVNIYFIDSSNSDWDGIASFPPLNNTGPVIRIIQSLANTSTVPHEVGHSLGLHHTFGKDYVLDGTDENIARVDSNGCLANHWYAGDGISDTPADIPGSYWRPCDQVIAIPDNCGNYNWDLPKNNIMSYWGCQRNSFTIQQGRAMHYILENWLAHIIENPVQLVEFNVLDNNNNPGFFGGFRTFFINRKPVHQGDEISLIVGKNYNSQMGLNDKRAPLKTYHKLIDKY